jgi:hypothetical protein
MEPIPLTFDIETSTIEGPNEICIAHVFTEDEFPCLETRAERKAVEKQQRKLGFQMAASTDLLKFAVKCANDRHDCISPALKEMAAALVAKAKGAS